MRWLEAYDGGGGAREEGSLAEHSAGAKLDGDTVPHADALCALCSGNHEDTPRMVS